MQITKYIIAYQSIGYLAIYSSWITGLAAVAITLSILVQGIHFYTENEEFSEIFKKIKKRFTVGVILILLTAIIEFLKRYFV